MTLTIPDDVRAKAEIYVGDAAGQEKTRLLLHETGLPGGLLPLKDIIECGFVEETGFVWLKQRRKVDHYFAKAGRHVSYGAEVSAVAEQGRLKKITGVKAKEMLIWVALNEICVDDPPKGKLHVKAMGGFSRTFPAEAFEADGPLPPNVAAAAAARAARGANCNGNGNGGAVAKEKEVVVVKAGEKKEGGEEEAKKEEGKKEEVPAAAAAAGEEKKEDKKEADAAIAAAVDKVEEKLKEMSTEVAHKHAEALAGKN